MIGMGGRVERHRIGVVGLGMALKPHLQSLRELQERVEIAACYTPSAERRDAFGRENPDLSITDSLERVLADKSIRSVLLLTPPTTHQDLVQRCAAAGKHVLLEKPLEVTVERGAAGGRGDGEARACASASCCSTASARPRAGSPSS